MWLRNVLFLGLLTAGVAALALSLYPPTLPAHHVAYDADAFRATDFRAVVRRVDEAVRKPWADLDVTPAPPADDLTVARRLSLALTGTVPSLQELRQFEAVPAADRVNWWLTALLQDRRYADYLAERLARTYVGTENGPFVLFRRRRLVLWLSDRLHENRPYDQVVRELIAGRGLWTDHPATNFVSVTIEPDNQKGPDPVRLGGRVARAFLGVRLDCAQCHNHPFQEWKQKDFHQLAAFFGQTRHGFTGIYDAADGEYEVEDRKTLKKETVAPGVPFLPELLPEEGTRRERLAAWVTDRRNGYFARATANRMWALLFGRPMAEPVDDLHSQGDIPEALAILADDFVAHDFDLRRLIQVIAATEAFRRDSAADHEITEVHEKCWAAFPMTRLRPEQVAGAVVQSGSLATINRQSHVLAWLIRYFQERDFVERYGDNDEDEFAGRGGTITQRLLVLNGNLVKERTQPGLFNASQQIAMLAADDARAVELMYLAALTRRPTSEEADHFRDRLAGTKGEERNRRLEDLHWTLLNSTEFAWNH